MNMLEDQIRKNILNSFTQSEVEKGVYTDNWLNRKLGRVGKEYTKKEGNKKEKDNLINSKNIIVQKRNNKLLTPENFSIKEFFNKNEIENTTLDGEITRDDFDEEMTFQDLDHDALRREIKKGKVSIKYKDGTFIDDLGKFIKDSKYIKYNSEEGFVDRSKLHKESPFKK